MGGWVLKGMRVLFWHDENVLKLTLVMVVQLCEYTKVQWAVRFIRVICMVYDMSTKLLTKEYSYYPVHREEKGTYKRMFFVN